MTDHTRLAKKYGGNAPRYTSFPTAPHFNESVTEEIYRTWLANITAGERTSVYVHVPYCHQLCWYCGCNTRATQDYRPVAQYLDALVKEIALVEHALTNTPIIQTLHWGGGTPTILSADDFEKAMQQLRSALDLARDVQIAVEIDPRSMTKSMTKILANTGVTRASLGVQEFSEHVQGAINRVQSYDQVVQVVEMLRAAGIASISFDLMYGLPNQTIADVETTAALTTELRPDRVSVFGYAHVPWMKPHQRLINEDALPSERERLQQAAAAARILEQAGYNAIGLDHFALPHDSLSILSKSGGLRRNFQGYTDDQASTLIGFGVSAIGSFPQGYAQNITDTRGYLDTISKGRLPVARGIEINDEDRLRRAIIERLMCDYSTNLKTMCEKYGAPSDMFVDERDRLAELEKDGLVVVNGDAIQIPDVSRPYLRSVCAVFDNYLKTGRARHSRAI